MNAGREFDSLFFGGDIITMDDDRPRASWVAVHHGRVAAVGTDVDGVPSARERVDLDGHTLMPGFHDAHNHMAWQGLNLIEEDVSPSRCQRLEELYAILETSSRGRDADEWVIAHGYDQNVLGAHPHRDELDRVTSGAFAWIKHRSGHMCVVSSAVLRSLGIDGPADDLPAGVAVDHAGRPTGLLIETTQNLLSDVRPPYSLEQLRQAVAEASTLYASEGITSVVETGIGGGWIGKSPVEARAYQEALDAGLLKTRVQLMPVHDALHPLAGAASDGRLHGIDLGLRTGFGDDWVQLGPVKIFVDGSLVGRSAALTFPYPDGTHGSLLWSQAELDDLALTLHRNGWDLAMHAIGDAAIDLALNALDAAGRHHRRPRSRHRIEHFGISRPDQIRRAAELGVVPVPQGRFVYEIGDGIVAAVGAEHLDEIYRLQSLQDAGLVLPGSSDRPVVNGSVLTSIRDMVRRRTSAGRSLPDGVSVEDALRAYTVGSAYAAGHEHVKGAIRPGYLADLAVLDSDPLTTDIDSLPHIQVIRTVVDGRTVYDATAE